jgi:hypothetical protein
LAGFRNVPEKRRALIKNFPGECAELTLHEKKLASSTRLEPGQALFAVSEGCGTIPTWPVAASIRRGKHVSKKEEAIIKRGEARL